MHGETLKKKKLGNILTYITVDSHLVLSAICS